jgi:ankyrin repeat protein
MMHMRAKYINENVEFTRGADPKEAMGVGMLGRIKADMKASGSEWRSPANAVYWAATNGRTEYLRFLHQTGEPLDVPDNNGWTPLFYAVTGGHIDTAEYLLDAGAYVNHQEYYGKTPLYWANRYDRHRIARLLIKRGGKSY